MKVILEQRWQLQELDRKMITLREGAHLIPDLKGKRAQFVNELPRSNGIEQCPNCKRILVAFSGDSPVPRSSS